jgi:hypothetical protein
MWPAKWRTTRSPSRDLEILERSVPPGLLRDELQRDRAPDVFVNTSESVGPPYYPRGSVKRYELTALTSRALAASQEERGT